MSLLCQHCHIRAASRPRNLCFRCFYTPGIRDLYPSKNQFACVGVGIGGSRVTLPAFPTTAVPGSIEKLAILERRARLNQAIFHPADARYEGDPRPHEFMKRMVTAAAAGVGI